MSDFITEVTDTSFEKEVIDSEIPVLVDYWASWCGPCKLIAPLLVGVAEEFKDKLKVCKVDVEENKEIPLKYNIRGIPTLMIFKNGVIDSKTVGALSKTQLVEFINNSI